MHQMVHMSSLKAETFQTFGGHPYLFLNGTVNLFMHHSMHFLILYKEFQSIWIEE